MGAGTKRWPSVWLRVIGKARIAKKCNNININGKSGKRRKILESDRTVREFDSR